MKNFWGKIIGGSLGFAIGGPVGAAAGLIIGHLHDMQGPMGEGQSPWTTLAGAVNGGFTGTVQQATFTMGVIVLGAKMAKADGVVTVKEIEAFKKVFQIAPNQVDRVGKLFDRARESSDGYEPYAFQLSQVFRNHPVILEEVLGGLFLIAAADTAGSVSAAETRFLKRVAYIFNMDPAAFKRIAARAGVRLPDFDVGTADGKVPPEPYAILGVAEDSTDEQVKTAYRALIRTHHPDKLVAEGLPPEFIATANEKMKRINGAYDAVCRMRGIK